MPTETVSAAVSSAHSYVSEKAGGRLVPVTGRVDELTTTAVSSLRTSSPASRVAGAASSAADTASGAAGDVAGTGSAAASSVTDAVDEATAGGAGP